MSIRSKLVKEVSAWVFHISLQNNRIRTWDVIYAKLFISYMHPFDELRHDKMKNIFKVSKTILIQIF